MLNRIIQEAYKKKVFFPEKQVSAYSLKHPPIFYLIKPNFTNSKYFCSVLKTHSKYGDNLHNFQGFRLINLGFIHILRNPLDVLLSYINYTRENYRTILNRNPSTKYVVNYQKTLFIDTLGFDRVYDIDEWEKFSLDTIPQKNLDFALDVFSDNNCGIPAFIKMSGNWIEHTASWKKAKSDISGCSIHYEDCLNDPSSFFYLQNFFDFSETDILESVERVNSRARNLCYSRPTFFNKMSAYYFWDYFSHSAIARFFNKHENILKCFGYGHILK